MKNIVLVFSFLYMFSGGWMISAQTPNQVIQTVNDRFGKVKDYSASAKIYCDIPFIRIKDIDAKVFYMKPDRFRIKADGIMILPKQDPGFVFTALADTNSYISVRNGAETYKTKVCEIISVIPSTEDADLILGKFWIEKSKGLIHKAVLTTRSNGTILMESEYGSQAAYALPDKMTFTVDVKKFKVPRVVAGDLGDVKAEDPATDKKHGIIILSMKDYRINEGVDPSVFKK